MKITALEMIQLPHLNTILWVRLHTDAGLMVPDGSRFFRMDIADHDGA